MPAKPQPSQLRGIPRGPRGGKVGGSDYINANHVDGAPFRTQGGPTAEEGPTLPIPEYERLAPHKRPPNGAGFGGGGYGPLFPQN